ncbi:hypothetical protein [Nocardioides pacificus]
MSEHIEETVDPAIGEAVHTVSNRFGVKGLEDLIALAQVELDQARSALEELARINE